MMWCYFISCMVESWPRDREDGFGKEFFSKAALSVSIQVGQFGPVAYKRTLHSESSSPNRMEAINECFYAFSRPGVNCWVTSDMDDISLSAMRNAPGPGTKLLVVIDPSLPDELRNYLERLVSQQSLKLSA